MFLVVAKSESNKVGHSKESINQCPWPNKKKKKKREINNALDAWAASACGYPTRNPKIVPQRLRKKSKNAMAMACGGSVGGRWRWTHTESNQLMFSLPYGTRTALHPPHLATCSRCRLCCRFSFYTKMKKCHVDLSCEQVAMLYVTAETFKLQATW